MMFRWINKQPGLKKSKNLCGHYQDIHDWISPFNKPWGLWFIPIQQSIWKWVFYIPSLVCFHFFEVLKDAFKVHFFQGFMFTPYYLIKDTDSMHAGPCSSACERFQMAKIAHLYSVCETRFTTVFGITDFSDADKRLRVDHPNANIFPRTAIGKLCGLSITDAWPMHACGNSMGYSRSENKVKPHE